MKQKLLKDIFTGYASASVFHKAIISADFSQQQLTFYLILSFLYLPWGHFSVVPCSSETFASGSTVNMILQKINVGPFFTWDLNTCLLYMTVNLWLLNRFYFGPRKGSANEEFCPATERGRGKSLLCGSIHSHLYPFLYLIFILNHSLCNILNFEIIFLFTPFLSI